MHESNDINGLTWKELGDVWYKSMHKGLDATSRFEDVQRCVLEAAKEVLPKSSQKQKLDVIKSAFSQLGYGSKATLTGTVTDYDTLEPIHYVEIEAKVGATTSRTDTGETGHFSVTIPEGNCYIQITHRDENSNLDYVAFNANMKLSASAPWGGNVLNVKLVKPGSGSLSGRIVRRTIPPKPAPNVTLKIRSGWNNQNGNPILTATTDSNGNYAFNFGENGAGYYTVEMVGNGYETATFNVTISGQTEWQDEYINGGEDEPDAPTPGSPDVPVVSYDIPIDEAHFPDTEFRWHIRTNIDMDRDGILSRAEIECTTSIDLNRKIPAPRSILASLNGIEYFVALENLICDYNSLTSLDMSKNTALKNLHCVNNDKLKFLNVSECTALQYLDCSYDNLTELDVSGCPSLKYLSCVHNKLITLHVSGCASLKYLSCSDNYLTTIDVSECIKLEQLFCEDNHNRLTVLKASGCTALNYLSCYNNQLIALDVSKCTALQGLACSNNRLAELDVSGCNALTELICSNNQLTTLDVSGCTALRFLICHDNQLKTLDVSNCAQNILLQYNEGVQVTYPPTSTTTTSSTSNAQSAAALNTPKILATLPAFTPAETASYTFTVSLDREIPEVSALLLLEGSEDLNGSFALTDEADTVRLSADFTAGRTYAPVIVAETEQQEQSGGCNSGVLGMVMLMAALLKKRRC